MKRIITFALSSLFAAVLLGVTGCEGGGGVDPGMPTDMHVDQAGVDKMKEMTDMSKLGTPPPSTTAGKPAPAKLPETPPAPEKKD